MTAIPTHLLASVPDPTDFPTQAEAPGLRKLDASFRCTICGEAFDAPVTLRCGHCFCSGCIRPAMAVKQECPTCRKTANEDHIRSNPIMEEAIGAWNESRAYILGLISREQELSRVGPKSSQQPRKRKRIGSSSSIELLGSSAGTSTPPTSRPKRVATASPRKGTLATTPSSDVEEVELINVALNPKPDNVVDCPLCQKPVKYRELNAHIDRGCKDPPNGKEEAAATWSKIMSNPSNKQKGKQRKHSDSDDDQRLPKASYATLKEKQIKEMLSEHGLSTQGDRSQLEQRHQRWVMIYNSNLDRSLQNRKTKLVLRQELKKWEETTPKRKKPSIDAKQHEITHKSEFEKLVASARASNPKSKTVSSDVSSQPLSPNSEAPTRVASHPTENEGSSVKPNEMIEID